MANRYGLDEKEVDKVRLRDKVCIYCHKEMHKPSKEKARIDWATIEHLNHLPPWDNHKTIAICCSQCNSSRGKKTITFWFESAYCTEREINIKTVAQPVVDYIKQYE